MIVNGNALHIPLADQSVQCAITSPPYWSLRNYGVPDQLGCEPVPSEYISNMVAVFREVWRVLKDNGTLWLVIGDKFASDNIEDSPNIKYMDMVGIPWALAFALRDDGWILRSEVIWHKTNPMPDPVKNRPTMSHEHIFLLCKSYDYYYDYEAVKEPTTNEGRTSGNVERKPRGRTNGKMGNVPWEDKGTGRNRRTVWETGREDWYWVAVMEFAEQYFGEDEFSEFVDSFNDAAYQSGEDDVWKIAAHTYSGAHTATFPESLVEPCLLAGSSADDIVFDPFSGSGTVGVVAQRFGRRFVGLELSMPYIKLAQERIAKANGYHVGRLL